MSTTVPTSAHSNTRSVIQNFRHNPKCLLVCLCVGAVVQGKMYLRYRQWFEQRSIVLSDQIEA